ncbi:hypothetical protein IV54_GL000153 [Levilactobacillus paucivorans]|uniref:Lipoprotein n=1 Tax=Levilactobacillus paucivorans TaxID=616990 RepID=A0A0R2LU89_9LACO|nr:hypothetical protein [Levilactobacillus paucivorans]KRO03499.1 hypothetical protein IV54_GL000153 [Levilactobacillus paucivorans]
MNRYIKRLMGVALLGTAILSLAACGKSGANQVNSKEITFLKDAQSSNQRIWYFASNDDSQNRELSKSTKIRTIFVTKNGKVTAYTPKGTGMAFKDINKKSDSQIISNLKKADRAGFDEFVSGDHSLVNSQLQEAKKSLKDAKELLKTDTERRKHDIGLDKSVLEEDKEDIDSNEKTVSYYQTVLKNLKSKEPKYEAPFASDLRAEVTTDSSGNKVGSERLIYSARSYQPVDTLVTDEYKTNYPEYKMATSNIPLQGTYYAPAHIFDDMYTGYTGVTDDKDFYLLTKTTNKKVKVQFDKTKTKNVKVTDY